MEAVCPTCQSAIDPARALARIRGTKVLTFCSAACAEGKPEAPPPTPPPTPPPARALAPAVAPVRAAAAPPSVQPAAVEVELEPEPRKRRKSRGVIIGASIVLLAGVAVVAVDYWPRADTDSAHVAEASVAPGERTGAAAPSPVAVAAAGAAEDAPTEAEAPIDPKRLYKKAVTELEALMDSSSRRVQRISAMALARTGDPRALARLHELLADESSPLIEVQIAYALARAGDEKGLEVLVGSLRNRQRDVKLDAARSLVQLGDDRGADQLRGMLSYKHYRIGAAGLLARLGDDKGFDLLRGERAGSRNSHEIVMRATVALGTAGDQEVAPDLVEILSDGRYQVGAAHALAALGNEAALPSLTQQLDIDAFRVQAALGLRRMKAEVDLAPLASALHAGNEIVRASAGEAILILTGDAKLAERD